MVTGCADHPFHQPITWRKPWWRCVYDSPPWAHVFGWFPSCIAVHCLTQYLLGTHNALKFLQSPWPKMHLMCLIFCVPQGILVAVGNNWIFIFANLKQICAQIGPWLCGYFIGLSGLLVLWGLVFLAHLTRFGEGFYVLDDIWTIYRFSG